MFFKSLNELENILKNAGTTIICLKDGEKVGAEVFTFKDIEKTLKNCVFIEEYSIDQIRDIIALSSTKATSPRFFVFKNAEKIPEVSQNAILKLLEEPRENYHFSLFTTSPEALLPTIRSRSLIYLPIRKNALETPPEAEKAIFELGKRLLVANRDQIYEIAEELHKKKDTKEVKKRDFALKVLETTIELAEKSYFKTKNEAFTRKINGLILAHDAIEKNGIIRLQIVANLV